MFIATSNLTSQFLFNFGSHLQRFYLRLSQSSQHRMWNALCRALKSLSPELSEIEVVQIENQVEMPAPCVWIRISQWEVERNWEWKERCSVCLSPLIEGSTPLPASPKSTSPWWITETGFLSLVKVFPSWNLSRNYQSICGVLQPYLASWNRQAWEQALWSPKFAESASSHLEWNSRFDCVHGHTTEEAVLLVLVHNWDRSKVKWLPAVSWGNPLLYSASHVETTLSFF